uniref:Uncharacterized protein n=1 Tax=Onchocerca volvulus TaxID=6282 RepID=A0A8R1XYT9_ONCVO
MKVRKSELSLITSTTQGPPKDNLTAGGHRTITNKYPNETEYVKETNVRGEIKNKAECGNRELYIKSYHS